MICAQNTIFFLDLISFSRNRRTFSIRSSKQRQILRILKEYVLIFSQARDYVHLLICYQVTSGQRRVTSRSHTDRSAVSRIRRNYHAGPIRTGTVPERMVDVVTVVHHTKTASYPHEDSFRISINLPAKVFGILQLLIADY